MLIYKHIPIVKLSFLKVIYFKVAWIKADSKAILAIHDHVITNKDKIKVTRNDGSTYVLTIEEVSPLDEGFYMCQVNSEPMLHQVICIFIVASWILLLHCTVGKSNHKSQHIQTSKNISKFF